MSSLSAAGRPPADCSLQQSEQPWSSGMMEPSQGFDPGSIPGGCIFSISIRKCLGKNYPWWDSNPQSLAWEANALSIRLQGLCGREWSSGRMAPCHGVGPGSIPGSRTFLSQTPAGSRFKAALAQLGERQTEDLKVPGSIPGGGTFRCPHHTSSVV